MKYACEITIWNIHINMHIKHVYEICTSVHQQFHSLMIKKKAPISFPFYSSSFSLLFFFQNISYFSSSGAYISTIHSSPFGTWWLVWGLLIPSELHSTILNICSVHPVGGAYNILILSPGKRLRLHQRGILGMTLNFIWWWDSWSGDLEREEYPFMATTPQTTMTCSG